jgi:hypothetical protein
MVSSLFHNRRPLRHDGSECNHQPEVKEETNMNITTVGLDLAKNVFHVIALDARGKEVAKKRLTRAQILKYFANTPRCLLAMEACASAHYFARELKQLGHEPKLIPPQYVKAYVRGQKNDYNDARAIAEAARVPGMRMVAIKSIKQQDLQALARLREGCLRSCTACAGCSVSTASCAARGLRRCAGRCRSCSRMPPMASRSASAGYCAKRKASCSNSMRMWMP